LPLPSSLPTRRTFPGSKSITIIVPFAAGGPTDRVARDLAEALRKPLGGSTVIIDNVPGAGSSIGAAKVARATPTATRCC
jgi:tripartite-type tricarboxylate transporter receptor subunit TctC